MTTKFILFCLLSFLLKTSTAQQWNGYNPTAGFDVNAVAILGSGHIAIGGGRESNDSIQIMFMSSDYGITWNENPHDGLASWNKSMAFSDSVNGYGVGYQGRIIQTNDGGQNWGYSVFPINRNLNKIVNVSPMIYYVVGGKESHDSMQTILKTNNGGTTWNVIYDTAGPCLRSVHFITALKGFAVGDSGVILATINGGGAWNSISPPVKRGFNAITFVNATKGFIAGGDGTHRTILQTLNGGNSWTVLMDTMGGAINDISFADTTEGYVVGDSAAVLKTTDGGQTWSPQFISNYLTGTQTFNAVKFYDRNFGVIAGRGGVLYVYMGGTVDILTLGSEVKDSVSVDVWSSVNTHGLPATANFVYSTDSTFTTFNFTSAQILQNDTFFPVTAHIQNLLPNTWYYYYASNGSKHGDTLRFFTGSNYPVFKTMTGNVIDSNTLQFKGNIHGLSGVSNIKFEYGTSPLLGNEMAASPVLISDTADYHIAATLNSALVNTIYYYRLKGEVAGDTLYGDIFYTGNPFHILQTLPPINVTDNTAVLNGVEQGNAGGLNLSFEIGLPYGQTFETGAYHFSNGDSLHYISSFVNGLQPGMLYNYRIKVQSGIGTFYGQLMAFYTGNSIDSFIQTLPAQNVTDVSAVLEGMVNHFTDSMTLSFEYSTDSSFTNSIGASPAFVNDTSYHQVSALLTGVPVNNMYYYRLKALSASGASLYGGIKLVFIGANEIPNWDFQYWNHHTFQMAAGWNVATEHFSRVPGHSGNYALNVTGVNVAIIGVPVDDGQNQGIKFIGGVPFTGRPDSLCFYMKGSIAPGDLAAVVVYLHKGDTVVAKNITMIPVNTGGVFQRVSLPISYQNSLMPDSLVLGITTVNPSYPTPGNQNNSITVDDFAFIPATSPVYNGNLETWYDYTVDVPDSWYAPIFYGVDSNMAHNTPIVSQVITALPYDYGADLRNVYFNSIGLTRGDMGLKNIPFYGNENPTFAVNGKHQTLNGFLKAFPVNGDSLGIRVNMYYHGNQIGFGELMITDSIPQLSPFEVRIMYIMDSTNISFIPDSADIEMHTYGQYTGEANGPSRMIVDKLRFDGFVAGMDEEAVAAKFDENGMKVYPNPSSDLVTLEILRVVNEDEVVQLYNISGQKKKELIMPSGVSKTSFSVADMEPGFYLLKWISGNKTANKKIVVVK